jgi:hypothetical protein
MAYKRKSTKRPVRKRKVYKKTGTVARLARQVKNLQVMCKPEKKYTDVNQDTIAYLGQYDTVGEDGAFYASLSPPVSAGNGVSGRSGNKIQLTSAYLQIQLRQQSSTQAPVRYRYWIMRRKVNSPDDIGSAATFNNYFLTNPFSDVRDYFSNPDMETMSQIQVIARGKGVVKGDTMGTGAQAMTAFIKRPLKLNFPNTYANTSSTIPLENKIYLFVQCDNGTIANNTGLQMEYTCRFWYTDM